MDLEAPASCPCRVVVSSASGASGNCPSTAWLPMTMMSRSFDTAAAARRMCSSPARFIIVQNGLTLFHGEEAGERTGLAQTRGLIASGTQEREQGGQSGPIQHLPPFAQGRAWVRAEPALKVGARHVQQLRLCLQLRRHRFMKRKTSPVNPLVRAHGPSIVRKPAFGAPLIIRGDVPARVRSRSSCRT